LNFPDIHFPEGMVPSGEAANPKRKRKRPGGRGERQGQGQGKGKPGPSTTRRRPRELLGPGRAKKKGRK
jgi:hypothetical protein